MILEIVQIMQRWLPGLMWKISFNIRLPRYILIMATGQETILNGGVRTVLKANGDGYFLIPISVSVSVPSEMKPVICSCITSTTRWQLLLLLRVNHGQTHRI